MKFSKISHLIAAGILGLSMLACNLGKGPAPIGTLPPEDSTSANTATEAPVDNSAAVGACTNPYLPIKAGATWNYKITGLTFDTFTRSILSVDAAGFTDQDVFGTGVTRQSKWNCENGNLIALNLGDGTSSSINTEGMTVNFQTTEFSGVTIPATINAGDTWAQSLTLEGTQDISGTLIPAKNQTTSNCTAIGIESVTVEAGTFDAMRFDCQTSINITVNMGGSDISTALNLNSSNWHAENIGLLKTVSTGEGLDSTLELVSYTIP